jgi:hypothetical protein
MTWRKIHSALVMLLLLVFGLGLRCSDRKKRSRYDGIDGGRQLLEECNKPADDCYVRCWNRSASDACNGCCWDQRFLCDTHQPHDFAYCDGAK